MGTWIANQHFPGDTRFFEFINPLNMSKAAFLEPRLVLYEFCVQSINFLFQNVKNAFCLYFIYERGLITSY